MTYYTAHETPLVKLQSSRLGDVIVTRKADNKEVYFQPGDAGSELLDILDESPPDNALHMFLDGYFDD